MLEFLLLTLVFIIGQSFSMFFFLQMTLDGGALDIVFGWQKMLRWCYNSKYKAINLLGNILGDCNMCSCFWSAPIFYILYRVLLNGFDVWLVSGFWTNAVWFMIYWNISAFSSFTLVQKINKDGM